MIIKLPGLTIDVSAVRSVVSADGLPQFAGKVVLTFADEIDGTTIVVTATWVGEEERADGMLVDFEGVLEDGDLIYEACELYELDWSRQIAKSLGQPAWVGCS